MNEVFLVCDESGATGLADKAEQAPRGIGLVAGVIVPKAAEATVRSMMATIAAKCPPSADGKLHITGLGEAASEALRKDVFKVIKDNKLTCVYSATASQGFHENFQQIKNLDENATKAKPAHIVDQNQRLHPDRLHAALFQGAFGVAMAWCEEQFGAKAEVTIQVRTDQVDAKILEDLRAAAAEIATESFDQTEKLKYFNKAVKKPIEATVVTKVSGAETYVPGIKVNFTIDIDKTPFTLLADVVTNSLYDHVKKRFEASKTTDLNGPEAVEGHELAGVIYGLNTPDGVPALSDVIHRHPGLPKLGEKVPTQVTEIKGGPLHG